MDELPVRKCLSDLPDPLCFCNLVSVFFAEYRSSGIRQICVDICGCAFIQLDYKQPSAKNQDCCEISIAESSPDQRCGLIPIRNRNNH